MSYYPGKPVFSSKNSYTFSIFDSRSNLSQIYSQADIPYGSLNTFSDTQIDESVTPTITDRDFTIASIAAPSIITESEEADETDEEVEGEEATDSETETETEEITAEKKEDKTEEE